MSLMRPLLPLTRYRRRILIATLVVVGLIGGVWWIARPKVDPRFVGTWDSSDGVRWVFRSDGTGECWYGGDIPPSSRVLGINSFRWTLEGDVLVIFEPGIARHLSESVRNRIGRLLGHQLSGQEIFRYEIIRVEAGTVDLKDVNPALVNPSVESWQRAPGQAA
jgi:hypothetical protein